MKDLIGISWRPELAAGILTNLEHIDVVEVMANDYFDVGKSQIRSLKTLAKQVPVVLHGVSLGLASCTKVERHRLEQMARVIEQVEPLFWSEHLAFVRAGGLEIGHLAAPPRTNETIEGSAENIFRATQVTGSTPLMENIATLIEPPGSLMDEASWITGIASASKTPLLLDLHNLYANSVNFHFDAKEFLNRIPLNQIGSIHLSGGKWVTADDHDGVPMEARLLDDHLHDVPDPVYDLLQWVSARTSQPLTVILERDGSYPTFDVLLAQVERARKSVRAGRESQQHYEWAEAGSLSSGSLYRQISPGSLS